MPTEESKDILRHSQNSISEHFVALIQPLCDIAESYYWLGRVEDAVKILELGMQLVDKSEVRRQD